MARLVIRDKELTEILALCQVAHENGSVMRLSDLVETTTIAASEEDLEEAWRLNPTLDSKYAIESGWIVERARGASESALLPELERQREERSKGNLETAREFLRLCAGADVRLLAVSGGNSYGRAGPGDDIDIFCITAADSLWSFMLRSLLLARFWRMGRGSPPICLSYVLDERRALESFHAEGDAIFARDALMARVMYGRGFYRSLLESSSWMGRYFPRLYAKAIRNLEQGGSGPAAGMGARAPGLRRVLNAFLYYTVGSYVRIKAYLVNLRSLKEKHHLALFRANLGRDRCVYESRRYVRLRQVYDGALKPRNGQGARDGGG